MKNDKFVLKVFGEKNRTVLKRLVARPTARGARFTEEGIELMVAETLENLHGKNPGHAWRPVRVGPRAVNLVWVDRKVRVRDSDGR